jgi:hypothetical protein
VQRTGDGQSQVGYSVTGRSGGLMMPCARPVSKHGQHGRPNKAPNLQYNPCQEKAQHRAGYSMCLLPSIRSHAAVDNSSSLKVEAPQIGNRIVRLLFIIKKGALFCILHMGPQIIGTALPCAVFIVHKEMRSTSFWLSLKTKVDGLSVVCLQNHGDDFSRFGLKTGGLCFLI